MIVSRAASFPFGANKQQLWLTAVRRLLLGKHFSAPFRHQPPSALVNSTQGCWTPPCQPWQQLAKMFLRWSCSRRCRPCRPGFWFPYYRALQFFKWTTRALKERYGRSHTTWVLVFSLMFLCEHLCKWMEMDQMDRCLAMSFSGFRVSMNCRHPASRYVWMSFPWRRWSKPLKLGPPNGSFGMDRWTLPF